MFIVQIVFTALRMYAIWYRNRKIFGVVLLLGVVPIGVNMVRPKIPLTNAPLLIAYVDRPLHCPG